MLIKVVSTTVVRKANVVQTCTSHSVVEALVVVGPQSDMLEVVDKPVVDNVVVHIDDLLSFISL